MIQYAVYSLLSHISMNADREQPVEYLQVSKAQREYEETAGRMSEYSSVLLFFFVFLPIFMWINCLNVSDWYVSTSQCTELSMRNCDSV